MTGYGSQPPLGLYHTVALSMMVGRPYDVQWESVLRTFDVPTLFLLSLRSREMCRVVLGYVRQHMADTCHKDELRTGGVGDYLSKLPVELFLYIFADTTMADRLRIWRVSRKYHALCARDLQAAVNRILRPFNLCHADLRFMQTATQTILAGPSLLYLFDPSFLLVDLDFYSPDDTYHLVQQFFKVATIYDDWPEHGTASHRGIRHRTTFARTHSSYIFHLNQSFSSSALDCIPYLSFSNLFMAITHLGLWLGYPQTTADGVAFPNKEFCPIGDSSAGFRVDHVLRHFGGRVKVLFGLNREHTCGVSFECPSTPHTTMDGGCLNIFFPSLPMGISCAPAAVYPADGGMMWSLDGRGCNADDWSSRTRRRRDDHSEWKADEVEKLIQAHDPPYDEYLLGVLLPTGVASVLQVSVPVEVTHPPDRRAIVYMPWMGMTDVGAMITVVSVLHSNPRMTGTFAIFSLDQKGEDVRTPNAAVKMMYGDASPPWFGNILALGWNGDAKTYESLDTPEEMAAAVTAIGRLIEDPVVLRPKEDRGQNV
ncbi:hypothetical protein DFH06DRAFT_1332500 [Mycena polygramma]|nr:hypothetical protein DFH06DRAFT_1332500 [Mycena polygramma]